MQGSLKLQTGPPCFAAGKSAIITDPVVMNQFTHFSWHQGRRSLASEAGKTHVELPSELQGKGRQSGHPNRPFSPLLCQIRQVLPSVAIDVAIVKFKGRLVG